jgi:monoamine oxidase
MKRFDIAIIGGGISGLYSAYRLKKSYPNKTVGLFESLPMFGGRIQTGSFADGFFKPAYGALRIEPDYQTEMHRFIQALNIPTKQIEQGEASSSSVPNLELLTAEEKELILTHPDLSADALLLDLGIKKILGHQWDIKNDTLSDPERNDRIKNLKKTAIYKNKPLYQQGAWNVFNDVLSYEAVEFFREKGAYYNMKNDNQNAADWIAFLLSLRLLKQSSYIPVGGMIQMIHLIKEQLISLGVELYLNHHLKELKQKDERLVCLQFDNNHSSSELYLLAEQVVLAIPRYSLKKLTPFLPEKINILLDSVIPIPILWATAMLKNPPWGLAAKPTSGERAPIRAAHLEFKEDKGEPYGLAMLYCDGPWHQYWRHFVEDSVQDYHGYQYLPQVNQNKMLKNEIEKTLKQHFDLSVTPSIEEWGIRDWGRPPFGAGVHFWKIGAQSDSIINTLKEFSLCEDANCKNMHICGEAYSECQGFFEGAVRTANYAVEAILQSYK